MDTDVKNVLKRFLRFRLPQKQQKGEE